MKLTSEFTPLLDHEVFAVDSTSAQIVTRGTDSRDGTARIRVGGQIMTAELTAGVAVINVDQLEPDSAFEIEILDASDRAVTALTGRTRPAIEPTAKVATISDVHLGAEGFGPFVEGTDTGEVPYALRCGAAAIAEAVAWGAQALIIKGDLTETGEQENWALAETMLAHVPIPMLFAAGNHDVWGSSDTLPEDGAHRIGVPYQDVQTLDLPGARVVLVDTARPGKGTGELAAFADEILSAMDTDDPVLLALHHQIQDTRLPRIWPPGISSTNAAPVLKRLEATPGTLLITSGHTHRNRIRRVGPTGSILHSEVSSTSDYPGVWAGYEFAGSLIRQTVRRIASPDALSWTEPTRRAVGGIWGRWSQGQFRDRCVDVVSS